MTYIEQTECFIVSRLDLDRSRISGLLMCEGEGGRGDGEGVLLAMHLQKYTVNCKLWHKMH